MTNSAAARDDDLWTSTSREALQRLTDLACRVLKARSARLSTFSGDRQIVLCHAGLPETLSPISFDRTPCHVTWATEAPIVAPSIREHPLLQAIDVPDIEAYLGVPIRLSDGRIAGILCVTDAVAHTWSADDLDLVRELAGCLASQLELDLQNGRRERAETALRESQARFAAIADNIPGLVFERRKIDATRVTYTFFGSRKADHAFTRSMTEDGLSGDFGFIHPDDREHVRAALLRSTVEESDLDLTFRAIRDDGTVAWLRTQAVARAGGRDGAAAWDGLCFDISDLVAARERADVTRDATEIAIVDVSHELRAPIQAIVGFSEFLATETRPDVIAAHAKNISIASRSVLAIVNQLLDTAGAEAASDAIEPIVAATFAETCLDLLRPSLAEKALSFELVLEAGLPAAFAADRQKLQQALLNLLANAVKFTDVGKVTLRVGRAGEKLRFSVVDTGIGIKEEERDRLFQRFSRLESRETARDGTGLGLAITKLLVEGMDGAVGVCANIGPGTTFWLEIPYAAAPVATKDATNAPAIEPASGARILLADDLDLNRKLISDMLALEGYVVDCVADGAAAVKAATDSQYDLILMDMIMPGVDGITATRAIRALPAPSCDVPIVALTANSFREQLDSCLSAGMDGTLTKPMSMDALTQAVFAWTHGRTKAA